MWKNIQGAEPGDRELETGEQNREHLEKKGSQGVRDWGHYLKTIEDLRAQIFANSVDNVCIVLQIDNAHIAANDFRVKYETELDMRQSVESDIHGHKVDAPKSQDLSKIMADIQAQNKELAQKNCEELDKYWSQKIEESTTVVTTQSAKIRDAETTLTDLRHTLQALEIDLDAMKNHNISLENSLRGMEAGYDMQMEQLSGVLLYLESELAQTRAEGQHQTQECEALLNIKVKLESEMATYRCLLEDGANFSLSDAPAETVTPCNCPEDNHPRS
ncbi:hypothetical protein ACRRTK_002477 [Alexandromys fortis]